jgi:arginine decarboxylase
VLGYVQYQRQNLVQRVRQASEEALRKGLLTFEESALLMRRFDEGLSGYTYLEEEEPAPRIANGGNGLTKVAAPTMTPAAAPAAPAAPAATEGPIGAAPRGSRARG